MFFGFLGCELLHHGAERGLHRVGSDENWHDLRLRAKFVELVEMKIGEAELEILTQISPSLLAVVLEVLIEGLLAGAEDLLHFRALHEGQQLRCLLPVLVDAA